MLDLVTHLRYNRWAHLRLLEVCGSLPSEQLSRDLKSSYRGVYGTLLHIYQGDSIWFSRLQGEPAGSLSAIVPNPDFAAFRGNWENLHDRLVAWGEGLSEAGWRRPVGYRDSKGVAYTTPVFQIVLHLVNHGTYHRGQVASMLRQLGVAPAGLDLILYFRGL